MIAKNPITNCWIWTRTLPVKGGYCQVKPGKVVVYAHRWVYECLISQIPDGFELHHTCFTPDCVNPDHLVQVLAKDHDKLHCHRRRHNARLS